MKSFSRLFFAFALIAAPLFGSCTRHSNYEGKVVDATVGSISICCGGDTLAFSTIDADPARVPGVLIGDVVKIRSARQELESAVIVDKVVSLRIVKPSNYRLIAGTWMRKGINDADFYGFTLADDGSAESVNNNTMLVRDWVLDGEEIALTVDSVYADGNKQCNLLYRIDRLDADSLILSDCNTGKVEWACARR